MALPTVAVTPEETLSEKFHLSPPNPATPLLRLRAGARSPIITPPRGSRAAIDPLGLSS